MLGYGFPVIPHLYGTRPNTHARFLRCIISPKQGHVIDVVTRVKSTLPKLILENIHERKVSVVRKCKYRRRTSGEYCRHNVSGEFVLKYVFGIPSKTAKSIKLFKKYTFIKRLKWKLTECSNCFYI